MKKLLVPFLLISMSATAQFNIEKLLSAPFPNELKASNDGKYITWVFNNKGVRNVWFADETGKIARQLTHYTDDDGLEITSLMITPDDNSVVFVRGNNANSKGENANPARLQTSTGEAVYIAYVKMDSVKFIGDGVLPEVSPDGKKIAYISSSQAWLAAGDSLKPVKLFQSRGSQAQLRWSPDGSKLAFVSNRTGHAFIGIYDLSTKTISYPDASTNSDTDPVWSPDGKYLAYIRQPSIGAQMPFTSQRSSPLPWSIRLMEVASLKANEIWKADEGPGSALPDELPAVDNRLWITADNTIIFPWEKDGWMHLYALDIRGKKAKLLTPGDGEVEKVVLSPDKKTIIYCTNIGDISRRHIYTITSLGTPVMVTKGDGIEYSPAALSKGIAVLESTAQHPLWPAIVASNGSLRDFAVNEFPKDYPSSSLVTPKVISFTATDGMQVPAQLFLPKNRKPGEKHPAIVFFHGGSRRQMLPAFHYMYYYYNAYALNQYYANKGYIVLSVNYRSGTGYGLNFREALNYGANGASEVNDAIGAGLYLQSRNDVDTKHIAAWGGSYGGYLTAFCLAKASDIFSGGVDMHGVHNWNTELGNWRVYDSATAGSFSQKAYLSSPIAYVDSWHSPVLLIQGDDDRNVPFSQTISLAAELGKRKVPFEELVFPDEVHDFLMFKTWVKAYNAAYDFISAHDK
jgi:dipeptidyl aminopeptidase/acylaminoacyl peptidase